MSFANLKVGDDVYIVRKVNRSKSGWNERWGSVTAVGRKWLTADGVKFNVETGWSYRSGYSELRLYRSQLEYEFELRREESWRKVRQTIDGMYSAPPALHQSDIDALQRILDLV